MQRMQRSKAWPRPSAILLLIAAGVACANSARATNDVAGHLITINDNGGWSWFQDERAIVDTSVGSAGTIILSSVGNASGTGGAPRNGDIEVMSLDVATSAVSRFTLHDSLQADDHDSAALWRRPDGRYLAMYSTHGSDNFSRYRISTNPGDISSWGAEQTINNGAGTTYSNLLYLSSENNGNGVLYDFTRTFDIDPHVNISLDQGATWQADAGELLNWPLPTGDPKYTGVDGSRPYVKYTTNGVDEIHFITSTDHPRAYDNSIYHGVVKGGKVYDSFGNVVDSNLFDNSAMKPTNYSTVFNTDTSPLGYAWTTDLQLDPQGHPYAAMTARNGSDSTDHRFLYGRLDGTQWTVHEVAKAGSYLYASENDYTGLMALDPSDANRIFISTPIDPRTNVSMPHYEIFQGLTADSGATWAWTPITFNSSEDNIRPIVPKWDGTHTALLWMRGTYSSYTNYDLDIVGLTAFGPLQGMLSGDLDHDGDVDLNDYAMYLSGLHTNLEGLTADQAYAKGDLNGDGQNDFSDFVLFRQAYDMAHGAGSLAAVGAAIPEPHASTLALFAAAFISFTRGERSRAIH